MKKIVIFLGTCALLWLSAQAHAATSIVTDIDDTIKITHVNDPVEAAFRGLFTASAFLGMSQLYNKEITHSDASIYYVSGSPQFLTYAVNILLSKNNFPAGDIYLRNDLGLPEIYSHKMISIKKIFAENTKDQFLMFGDDTERDFEVYHDLQAIYPGKILASYIHLVRNNVALPKDVIGYFNAADLALHEALAGRISEAEAKEVLQQFLSISINEEELLPDYAACPADGWLTKLANQANALSSLQSMAPQVEEKLKAKCAWNIEQKEKQRRQQEWTSHHHS